MIVSAGPDWRIRTDPHNWIVERRHTNEKTGEPYWKPVAYCSTHKRAMFALASHALRAIEDIEEVAILRKIDDLIVWLHEARAHSEAA